jgi:hypothetical protein
MSGHERMPSVRLPLCGSRSQNKMQNQRNHSEHQEQVNESTGYVKYCETAKPGDQQNDE